VRKSQRNLWAFAPRLEIAKSRPVLLGVTKMASEPRLSFFLLAQESNATATDGNLFHFYCRNFHVLNISIVRVFCLSVSFFLSPRLFLSKNSFGESKLILHTYSLFLLLLYSALQRFL
jgi:hypothetical protein